MRGKIITFAKKEIVLLAAIILAILSAFFVTPSLDYVGYIDWRVLGILLSLMIVMAGLQRNGFFDAIGTKLLSKTRNTLQLSLILVFLCFFFSMLITNDVALLTFVPFAVLILEKCEKPQLLIPVIVLQTIAANLGSMLTPVGNPQNLYLYNLANMTIGEFVNCMLPYTLLSFLLLLASVVWIGRKKESIQVALATTKETTQPFASKKRNTAIYMILFLLSLLVVLRVLPYYVVLAIVIVSVWMMDRVVLKQVDYCLLFTFIGFFVFTGNIGNIPMMKDALQQLVVGNELGIGILSSQVISNVPAALLLSEFTENYRPLLIGVNVGGLGTLIASMASLISFKIYAQHDNQKKGKYFFWFTAANIGFLIILGLVAFFN